MRGGDADTRLARFPSAADGTEGAASDPGHHLRCADRLLAGLAFAVWLAPATLGGNTWGSEPVEEARLKAAFLYHFTRFIDWPPRAFRDAEAPFVVGVLGETPVSAHLRAAVKAKHVKGRRIEVVEIEGAGEAIRCHMLFVSGEKAGELAEIRRKFSEKPILIVGETKGFARRGGMIGFVREGRKIRFEINVKRARKAGLVLSSKLLSLARIVEDEPGQ